MLVVPGEIPVTTPEAEIVPTAVLLLLHVPPCVASVSVEGNPLHIIALPEINAADEFTVYPIVAAVPQPVL